MLENTIQITKKEAAVYPALPKDIYQVELLDINSEEKATYDTRNKEDNEKEYETVLKFQFTILKGQDGENDLRGRNVWANFVPTYLYVGKNGKNNLYRIIEALFGAEISQEQEANGINGNDLNALIGRQCRISVEPKKSKDGTKEYDNINDYLKANETLSPLTAEEKEECKVKKNADGTDIQETAQNVTEVPNFNDNDIVVEVPDDNMPQF